MQCGLSTAAGVHGDVPNNLLEYWGDLGDLGGYSDGHGYHVAHGSHLSADLRFTMGDANLSEQLSKHVT